MSDTTDTTGRNVAGQLDSGTTIDDNHKIKRFKSDDLVTKKNLEERLGDILVCTVCLDDSKSSIYQCINGHLMCAACFTHLLTDARLKDEQATCPNCRCEISRQSCSRSLIAEKILSQMPINCQFCKETYLRCDIDRHERDECIERSVECTFNWIGCSWEGPYHELENHVNGCYKITHPTKQNDDILRSLKEKEQQFEFEKQSLLSVINAFSYEKVCFQDLQFRPYKTDDITPKLYFETSRFTAFLNQWVIKARVNDDQKNPNLYADRYISYQLILKTKLNTPSLDVKFFFLKGPFGEVCIQAKVNSFEFTSTKCETDYIRLGLESSFDFNRLLASKTINLRFFIFQA